MTGFLLRATRIAAYLGLTLVLVPLQAVLLAVHSKWARHLPAVYHRGCCRIFGIGIERYGAPTAHRPTLFIANHTSYLDITILGATLGGSFVAKAEVARWPVFNWLARLQRTVFVERTDRAGVARQRDAIRRRLDSGDNLILFPEGTSGDGVRLLPFKTALFSAAEDERVLVQPVSVAYCRLDGIPLGRFYRPLFAWYGDMTMAAHLWTAIGMGRLTVAIVFHESVRWRDFGSRKALADHCAREIGHGLSAALSGRPGEIAREPVRLLAAQ
jgi:1-acyl-sn-glycerol-3-phosphate acyltransferase